jgi:mono/diheme cytochrome c family protein
VPPSSLHDAGVRGRPVGHVFNTITNGIRTMPSYAAQIDVLDRWAIVAYVRALQRSQHGSPGDLPPDQLAGLR